MRLGDLEALQGVVKFPVRIKCATLAWNTLQQGLDEIDRQLDAASRTGSRNRGNPVICPVTKNSRGNGHETQGDPGTKPGADRLLSTEVSP